MDFFSLIVGLATKVAHVCPPYKKRSIVGDIVWN